MTNLHFGVWTEFMQQQTKDGYINVDELHSREYGVISGVSVC
jgi:hypothetical protein